MEGGPEGHKHNTTCTRIAGLIFFSRVGGPGGHKHTCDNLTQRHYVTLTLYAVRGYVTLTQHLAVRGYDALLIIFSMSCQLSTASGSALSKPCNRS